MSRKQVQKENVDNEFLEEVTDDEQSVDSDGVSEQSDELTMLSAMIAVAQNALNTMRKHHAVLVERNEDIKAKREDLENGIRNQEIKIASIKEKYRSMSGTDYCGSLSEEMIIDIFKEENKLSINELGTILHKKNVYLNPNSPFQQLRMILKKMLQNGVIHEFTRMGRTVVYSLSSDETNH